MKGHIKNVGPFFKSIDVFMGPEEESEDLRDQNGGGLVEKIFVSPDVDKSSILAFVGGVRSPGGEEGRVPLTLPSQSMSIPSERSSMHLYIFLHQHYLFKLYNKCMEKQTNKQM